MPGVGRQVHTELHEDVGPWLERGLALEGLLPHPPQRRVQHHHVVRGQHHDGSLCQRRGGGNDLSEKWRPLAGRVDQRLPFQRPQVEPPQQTEHGLPRLFVPPVHHKHIARPVGIPYTGLRGLNRSTDRRPADALRDILPAHRDVPVAANTGVAVPVSHQLSPPGPNACPGSTGNSGGHLG